MRRFFLPFGRGNEVISLPEERVLYDLHGQDVPAVADEEEALLQAVRHPVGTPPLSEVVKPGGSVVIVISDVTRLVHTDHILHVLIGELNRCGIADDQITLLVATGTHRAHTAAENQQVCGSAIADRLRIVQHDCHDTASLVRIGCTSFGNEVWINRLAAEADTLILTGAVSFHPMAGFGGGRKALLPGIAGFDTIMRNHSLALAKEPGGGCNPNCDASILEGNPFHEDMMEACAMAAPDFLVNTVFSADGMFYEAVAGHWDKAWRKGCADLIKIGSVPIQEQADITIASAGGYPKDLNYYQSIKAYMNAVTATKPGGMMIFTLDCPDITEPEIFTDWFFRSDLEQCEQELRREFLMPGFVAFKGRCIIRSMHRVYVVTRPENFDIIRKTGQIPARTLEEAWHMAQEEMDQQEKSDYKVTVMSHAAALLPRFE